MATFTFWNIDNQDGSRNLALAAPLVQLAIDTRCDVLVTAETGDAHVGLESFLQQGFDPNFRHMTTSPCRVHIWARLSSSHLRPVKSEPLLHESLELLSPSFKPALLVFAHLRSKPGRHTQRELTDSLEFAAALRELECKRSKDTLVLGDLNLNPYDFAMRAADSLNSVASRRMVAARSTRRLSKVPYHRFYNPTWNLMGDANGPPGTYYWHNGREETGWYVLDHVLVRAGLVSRLRLTSLRVVTTIGQDHLITSNGILDRQWPDHLPLTFELDS